MNFWSWLFPKNQMPSTIYTAKATSFADPADIEAFKKAKSHGMTDEEAFNYGDNGEGCWGDLTAQWSIPMCALPPETMIEIWGSVQKAKHKAIRITNPNNSKTVVAMLADEMPHVKNIHNGARLDMNPATCKALGLTPPVSTIITWQLQ